MRIDYESYGQRWSDVAIWTMLVSINMTAGGLASSVGVVVGKSENPDEAMTKGCRCVNPSKEGGKKYRISP